MRGLISPLIKLVIFLVVTTLATYVLAATIANSSFGATNSYKADFTDVTGLQLGDDVRIAGVRVGTVTGMHMVRDNQGAQALNGGKSYAEVDFTVQTSTALAQADIVRLRYRNLVGQRYLDVEQGPGDPNATLRPGGTIPISQTQPAVDLTVLFNGFKPLTEALNATQINDLTGAVVQTLQGEGGSFTNLLKTVADLTNTLADKDQVIGSVIDNLSGVLVALDQHSANLGDLIVQLKNFLSGLAADRNTIGNAIDGINNLATSTTGLLAQTRGPLAQDIKDITGLVANLNANSDVVTYVVQQLPPTVAGLIRTASYGSWFNFYLCSLSGEIVEPGGVVIQIPNISHTLTSRCG
jgi:phospholipid/cholesterol/gamma-HCH transport system substrate-binding protein